MANLQTEWQLEKYFYKSIEDPELQRDLEKYKRKVEDFISTFKGKISSLNEQEFLNFLEVSDSLDIEAEKVLVFLGFSSSLDTQNQKIQKENSRVQKILTDYSEKLLFIEEEFKEVGYEKLMAMSELEIFKPFKNYLISYANELKYLLTEPQEKVFLKLSNANSSNTYEELTTSFEFNYKGENITEDEVRMLRESPDRETRKEAFNMLADVYSKKQNQIVFGNIYSNVCKNNIANMELRNIPGVMSTRNLSEELSDEAVENLLHKVSEQYFLYHQFLGKKAEIIGVNRFETYDILAPFPSTKEDVSISFEEGWNLYKQTIEKVDPVLASFSEDMIRGGRISVFPKQGKTTGAYAQYTKHLPEFVLLNWANTYSDVTTLAHELGHAFHGSLSKRQKASVYHTPLTLAETASIFNETLMFETMLEATEDKELRKKLIFSRLDDIFATIFRQVAYVMVEKRCHESFKNNQPLTYEDYNRIWFEEMSKLYGPAVYLHKHLMQSFWSAIPHIFYTPFYCYTYAFGNLISLNLYQNFKMTENKHDFIRKYHELLAAGGSDTPENLLNDIFQIKFNDDFYMLAFSNIHELISKLDE